MKAEERFFELALRYLDGRSSEAETRELNDLLRSDPEARAWLWEIASQATDLADLARAQAVLAPNAAPVRAPAAHGRRVLLRWAAAAAVLVLIAMASVRVAQHARHLPVATVVDAIGGPSWTSDGVVRLALVPGQHLPAGTVSVENEAGALDLRFHDGTRLTLGGGSELSLVANPQKQVHLKHGTLFADVTPQKKGQPMLLRTPAASIEVLGTRFSVSAAAEETAVHVQSGVVRMRRTADGKSIEVPASQAGIATLAGGSPLMANPQGSLPGTWRMSFGPGNPDQLRGRLLPEGDASDPAPRIQARPYVARRNPDGTAIVRHGIAARGPLSQQKRLVAVDGESVLYLRYRTARPVKVKVMIGLYREQWEFGGNFQTVIPSSREGRADSPWQTVDLPLCSLDPITPEVSTRVESGGVFLLLVCTPAAEDHLEVAEVVFKPGPATSRPHPDAPSFP